MLLIEKFTESDLEFRCYFVNFLELLYVNILHRIYMRFMYLFTRAGKCFCNEIKHYYIFCFAFDFTIQTYHLHYIYIVFKYN